MQQTAVEMHAPPLVMVLYLKVILLSKVEGEVCQECGSSAQELLDFEGISISTPTRRHRLEIFRMVDKPVTIVEPCST
jgi:hypothetical protein